MKTMKILDGKKLEAILEARGITRAALAREIVRLSGGDLPCSPQSVGGWIRGEYHPHVDVTPIIQMALSVEDFGEIAKPIELPKKMQKAKKGD